MLSRVRRLFRHEHPSPFWGDKCIFFTDRYLPQGFDRRRFGYTGHACAKPGCGHAWLDNGFYEDATDEELVLMAAAMKKADGYDLAIPDWRKARVAPQVDRGEGYRRGEPALFEVVVQEPVEPPVVRSLSLTSHALIVAIVSLATTGILHFYMAGLRLKWW